MKRILFTPLSILLLILFALAGAVAIEGIFISSEGGNSLGGGIALMFAIVFLGLLLIEQKIVEIYNHRLKKICIIELIIIGITIIILIVTNEFSVG